MTPWTCVLALPAGCLAVSASLPVLAFELSPLPTNAEVLRAKKTYGIVFRATYPAVAWGLHSFSNPVHEALTQQAHDCDYTLDVCSNINLDFASSGVIAGVRWNDDPPFRFGPGQGRYTGCPRDGDTTSTVSFALRTECWLEHFRDVAKRAERKHNEYVDGKGSLLARSHFGDLQFLHSMASGIGTSAAATRSAILAWAEFTWRVQSPQPDHIAADVTMGAVPVDGLQQYFPATEVRTVSELFTVGRPWLRYQLGDVAFGSLLHMVEDSFSGGHAARAKTASGDCPAPPIVKFFTYAGQDKNAHKRADTRQAASAGTPALVQVMKELVRLRMEKANWLEVRPYIENCVYALSEPNAESTSETAR